MNRAYMASQQEFVEAGVALSREAGVVDSLHAYFVQHAARLYQSGRRFQLFERKLGDVLEIGPFYGYLPFVLQRNASSYTVLEGDDPAAYPLKPLYQKREIGLQFVDLFEMFGPTRSAPHALPFADSAFDTVICWGTVEHFNFNPVKFVRELHRVLKPGGRACIQVPNKASFQNLIALAFGRFERDLIDSYYKYENYTCNGKTAFYGFHWREYSGPEFERLFSKAGFTVRSCQTSVSFQTQGNVSMPRQAARFAAKLFAQVLPRYGPDLDLIAEK